MDAKTDEGGDCDLYIPGAHMKIEIRDISSVSNGHPLNGYYASPPGSGPFPGVVVIHEIFGLNDNIKDIAHRFAAYLARVGLPELGVSLSMHPTNERTPPGAEG